MIESVVLPSLSPDLITITELITITGLIAITGLITITELITELLTEESSPGRRYYSVVINLLPFSKYGSKDWYEEMWVERWI